MNEALLISAVHQQELTEQAQNSEESLRQHHAQLRSHAEELTRFNRIAVGRELRMVELKQEVNDLLARLGESALYRLDLDRDVVCPIASDKASSPAAASSEGVAGLESVLCTEELERRPARPPDYESENRALAVLTQVLADSPHAALQTLADLIVETLPADSGGVSLMTNDESSFFWPAIAGIWRPHIGKGTPRHFGPCGDVLDRGTPLLFTRFERRYGYFQSIAPPAEECLLVPFRVHGKAVGMVWAMMHDVPRAEHRKGRKFDAEDLRQLESLARFASVAYQSMEFLGAVEQRHAALNLMEDAVQMQDALRISEVRYRRLFESSKEGIVILDAKIGKITDANPFLAEMLCYPREEHPVDRHRYHQ